MASILVVCTGNICRSPIAQGFLAAALEKRFPDGWIEVRSAGTWAGPGTPATAQAIEAALERGLDIDVHRATRLSHLAIEQAALVIGLAAEHRDEVMELVPEAADRTFTLKELAALLDELPGRGYARDEESMAARVAEAAQLRRERPGVVNRHDEDVTDPIGMSRSTYRAIAWEIDGLVARVADGLFGPFAPPVEDGAPEDEAPAEPETEAAAEPETEAAR